MKKVIIFSAIIAMASMVHACDPNSLLAHKDLHIEANNAGILTTHKRLTDDERHVLKESGKDSFSSFIMKAYAAWVRDYGKSWLRRKAQTPIQERD